MKTLVAIKDPHKLAFKEAYRYAAHRITQRAVQYKLAQQFDISGSDIVYERAQEYVESALKCRQLQHARDALHPTIRRCRKMFFKSQVAGAYSPFLPSR